MTTNERSYIPLKFLLPVFSAFVGIAGYLANATFAANKEAIAKNERFSEDTRAALYREIGPINEKISHDSSEIESLKIGLTGTKERISRLEGHEDALRK